MPRTPKIPFESNSVWLYRNVHTNQVIFSLKKVLQPKAIEQQFPVPQRRMFPLGLRKDHWIPLVHAQFPTHLIANHIFKRLLDYRAWRLTAPPELSQLSKTKKQRNKESLNQVPTAIADLAHVTKEIKGKMIMNWDRFEERNWATLWNKNIWHCKRGFSLKRGYRMDSYQFPRIPVAVRKELKWDGEDEPPRYLKDAVEKHATIWKTMHSKMFNKSRKPKEKGAEEKPKGVEKEKNVV